MVRTLFILYQLYVSLGAGGLLSTTSAGLWWQRRAARGGSGGVHGLHSFIHHLDFQECYVFCENSSSSFFTLVPPVPVKEIGEN